MMFLDDYIMTGKGSFNVRLWHKIMISILLGIILGLMIRSYSALYSSNHYTYILTYYIHIICIILKNIMTMFIAPIALVGAIHATYMLTNQSIKNAMKYVVSITLLFVLIGTLLGYSASRFIFIDVQKTALSVKVQKASNIFTSENYLTQDGISLIKSSVANFLPASIVECIQDSRLLPIVLFGILIGVAWQSIGNRHGILLKAIIKGLYKSSEYINHFLIRIMPITTFFLTTKSIISQHDISQTALAQTVLLGYSCGLLQMFALYPMIIMMVLNMNPLVFWQHAISPILAAFGSSSSTITMPIALSTMINKFNVRRQYANLIIPSSPGFNMPGTAMYIAMIVFVFIDCYDIHLTSVETIEVMILIICLSMISTGISGYSLVIIYFILITYLDITSYYAPILAIIISIDKVMDMMRSSVNVMSAMVTCLIVEKIMLKKEGNDKVDMNSKDNNQNADYDDQND